MLNITQEDKVKLDEFIKNLDSYKERLELFDYIHHKEEFFWVMKSFRNFFAGIDDQRLCDIFFHSKHYQGYKNFFREKNDYYMRAIESVEAISIMTKWIHWTDKFMDFIDIDQIRDRYYRKADDIRSIDFSDAKVMIVVWSWPMPETMLYIYENTNIEKMIWIDNNYEAIYIAWEMVSSLWLENISLLYADWVTFDYSEADVIYIPAFVNPKKDVLDRIWETSKDTVQILVGNSLYMNRVLYDLVPSDIHPRLILEKKDIIVSPYYREEMIKLVKYNI